MTANRKLNNCETVNSASVENQFRHVHIKDYSTQLTTHRLPQTLKSQVCQHYKCNAIIIKECLWNHIQNKVQASASDRFVPEFCIQNGIWNGQYYSRTLYYTGIEWKKSDWKLLHVCSFYEIFKQPNDVGNRKNVSRTQGYKKWLKVTFLLRMMWKDRQGILLLSDWQD
jgi:hypothetical protein